MDWIPIVFVIFKFLVLGTGMFFAIKWHYDQGKKGKQQEARAVLRTSAKVAAVFVLAVIVLGVVTLVLARVLGMDLNLS
jgi:Na+-driven multidrug efflux pump